MKRLLLFSVLLVFCFMPFGENVAQENPSPTPTEILTETWTPTATWTATGTWTPTATWTATPTWTATWTPIVQTVVVTQPALPPVIITQPPVILTAPPPPPVPTVVPVSTIAPLPTNVPAPTQLTPFYGWQRYQSIHFIAVVGVWAIQNDQSASARQYRSSSSSQAIARYPFTGDGVRLVYRAHPQGCLFDVLIDNSLIASINSYASEASWRTAGPFFLNSGYHVFDIRSQAQESGVCSVDFDYIDVFLGPPMPESAQTESVSLPTEMPAQDVARVVLISAPPTALPSPTAMPPSLISLSVQVSYDANASDTADLGEGVRGVSVRVVNATTGELLQSGLTDERGALRFQIISYDEVAASIPLLARTLNLRPAQGHTLEQTWTILLPAANHPAVIP